MRQPGRRGGGLSLATVDDAVQDLFAPLARSLLRTLSGVGPLDQFAAVTDTPLDRAFGALRRLDLESVAGAWVCAHAFGSKRKTPAVRQGSSQLLITQPS